MNSTTIHTINREDIQRDLTNSEVSLKSNVDEVEEGKKDMLFKTEEEFDAYMRSETLEQWILRTQREEHDAAVAHWRIQVENGQLSPVELLDERTLELAREWEEQGRLSQDGLEHLAILRGLVADLGVLELRSGSDTGDPMDL